VLYVELSNEELAARIQDGESQYIDELYRRTRKLLSYFAKLHSWRIKEYPDLSIDDLIQCGYFALAKAIHKFDRRGAYDFNSMIHFKYRHEVNRLLGKHRENGGFAFRPVVYSLNEKEINADDAPEKQDLLVDNYNIVAEYEKKELSELVTAAIEQLPAEERDVIIALYFHDKKKAQIAREQNLDYRKIQLYENRALNLLSANEVLREYYYNVYRAGVC
jgi:RNA polymerase sigma factor (sigma-70 family)